MRSPIFLACLFLPAFAASADDGPTVLEEGRDGGPPRTMLSRFLLGEVGKALEGRRSAVAAIKTPEALAKRQGELKARFLEALGDLPAKTPLNARVVGTIARDGYRVERVMYESRPHHHVTALFYLPDGPPPFPAVLIPCGHDTNGKAAEPYQRGCILLAKNGIASLCYDPIGQAERRQLLDGDGKPAGPGNTTEHTLLGVGALLVGRSTAGYRVWDGIRSLDYLASRPEVDPSRLGCSGCSGGGTLTSYLMALDDRVAVAAPSCYITSLDRLFATLGPQDAEQNITGQVAFGLDHADYLGLRAPKPTLVLASTRDFFDIQGTWTTFREAKRTFGLLGLPERVDIVEADEAHGYTRPHREAMARWMRRWLLGKDAPVVEGDLTVEKDADLLCTRSGQVLADLKGKSAFDLNVAKEAELSRRRVELSKTRDRAALLADVRRLIALREPIAPAGLEDRGEAKWKEMTVRKLVFATEGGIKVPARLFTPTDPDRDAPLTVLVGYDADEATAKDGPVDRALAARRRVLVADLRGMGESALPGKFGPLIGPGMHEAFLSLHLGRPLLGQRVGDLLSVLAALAGEYPAGFAVIGRGAAGPVALHAAALEPKIVELTLDGSIYSWAEVVRTPLSKDQLVNAVPGVLVSYDLPDLAALLPSGTLKIRSEVDPEGRPVLAEKAQSPRPGRPAATREPLVRTVDLAIGESQSVRLADGKTATVRLLGVEESRDPIRSAVREARATIEVNGKPITLASGNYQLPVEAGGVQVDCPITRGYLANTNQDHWGLVKDARIRLWPAASPWIDPTTFAYPARQRWFASSTQMANEPVYVDGGENPAVKQVYYHDGLDISGAEGLIEIVSATDGLVVGAGVEGVPWLGDEPFRPASDAVHVLDDRGWYHAYEHLQSVDPAAKVGMPIRMGQKVGVLGKEGGSGGWSHLHYAITSRQPSGRWGRQEGYAFLWQAYLRERKPEVLAVARPHRLANVGEPVVLDGSKSWSRSGRVASFEWTFSDGSTATGSRVERTYARPGSYSEILKVADGSGNVDYDFAIVQVLDRSKPAELPPTIHATYAPTLGIRPGDPVTFKVRTFRTTDGREAWDFGDGTPAVEVKSDGNVDRHAPDGYAVTTHRFEKAGQYLVRVERSDRRGFVATARLVVTVGGDRGD